MLNDWKSKIKIVLLMLMFVFPQVLVIAQKITVSASIDSTQLWIGQQTELHFKINQLPDQQVQTPIFSDEVVGGLELVEQVQLDSSRLSDGSLNILQSYLVTAFEDSLLLIPPFPFVVDEDTVWSNSLSLKVIQPFEIDTAQIQVADIKDVFKPKFNLLFFLKKVLPWLLGILLLTGLVFLMVLYFKKRTKSVVDSIENKLPPHLIALAKLEKIKEEKLWQQNRHKEYHSALTDVLRAYLEERYGIQAMEMTSDEILHQLGFLRKEHKTTFELIRQIMYLADLIKFAKWNVGPDEHELSLNNAILFVTQTKVEEEIPEDDIS